MDPRTLASLIVLRLRQWLRQRQGDRAAGDWLADLVAAFSGSWPFVLLSTLWYLVWFGARLDLNVLTNAVSLEAIYLTTFVLMSGNRAARASQAQSDRMETMERHLDTLVSVDHEEHGRLLRDLHAHVTCEGHTTIGQSAVVVASAQRDAAKTTNAPKAAPRRQNRTLRAMPHTSPNEAQTTPNA